jgi:hypothetical protein
MYARQRASRAAVAAPGWRLRPVGHLNPDGTELLAADICLQPAASATAVDHAVAIRQFQPSGGGVQATETDDISGT